jgi:hypothetical protein
MTARTNTIEPDPAYNRRPTLYKSPPQNVRVGMDGYFRTRKLDARKHGIVDTVLAHAKRRVIRSRHRQGQSTRTRLSRRACCVIAFERVEAAEPAMLEAAKEALVYLDAPLARALVGPALRDYCSLHHTVLAPTNKYLAKSNKSRTRANATKKRRRPSWTRGRQRNRTGLGICSPTPRGHHRSNQPQSG